jgi:hypothetical protein
MVSIRRPESNGIGEPKCVDYSTVSVSQKRLQLSMEEDPTIRDVFTAMESAVKSVVAESTDHLLWQRPIDLPAVA